MAASSYTLYVRNELLGRAHFEGTYESYGAAEARAHEQAARSRSFATFQVHAGSPRNPGKTLGPEIRGTK